MVTEKLRLWALAGNTTRKAVTNTEEVNTSEVAQAAARISTEADSVVVADTNTASDADWVMIDPVLEPAVTLTDAERCICTIACGGFRCEARVCPTSGPMDFLFCEHCSDYMCECHIHGHGESDKCKHVCACATCVQLSGLTAAETTV